MDHGQPQTLHHPGTTLESTAQDAESATPPVARDIVLPQSPNSSHLSTQNGSAPAQDAPGSPVGIHPPHSDTHTSHDGIAVGSVDMRGADHAVADQSAEQTSPKPPSTDTLTAEQCSGETSIMPGGPDSHTKYSIRRKKVSSPPLSPGSSQTHVRMVSAPTVESDFDFGFQGARRDPPTIRLDSLNGEIPEAQQQPQLQYFHTRVEEEEEEKKRKQEEEDKRKEEEERRKKAMQRTSQGTIATRHSSSSDGQTGSSAGDQSQSTPNRPASRLLPRPGSSYSLGADLHGRGRSLTPIDIRRNSIYLRNQSTSSAGSSDARHSSALDLLNIPYAQQMAHQLHTFEHTKIQRAVGSNASLADTRRTLEAYRANIKKTTDIGSQYEFALLLVNTAQAAAVMGHNAATEQSEDGLSNPKDQKELLKEARTILQRLADRGFAYAQYYLADGFSSGLFNNGKEDPDRAFPFFIAAGKHGHAEAAYRTGLCYEFGWGCRRDPAKAAQFLRQAASRGHPGAAVRLGKACLTGDLGQGGKYREGIKWLKRATENADNQHNSAPYELGILHVSGFGGDIFKDEAYAAQLFTKAAELGHPEANLRMGEVYEHGLLSCPRDPALSIHFYNCAAELGLADAMMALCAWYMVGAPPVLQKDEAEAYEWARKASETGEH